MGELDSHTSHPAPEPARRTLTDSRGRTWIVHEQRAPPEEWSTADHDSHAHGFGVGWLVFEHEGKRKLLRLYPVKWHSLPECELRRLCSRARRFR